MSYEDESTAAKDLLDEERKDEGPGGQCPRADERVAVPEWHVIDTLPNGQRIYQVGRMLVYGPEVA